MIRSRLIYIALLISAFVFSQALYDSISLFTLAVVLLIPLISLLFFGFSLMLVRIEVEPVQGKMNRLNEIPLRIHIRSKAALMLPMVRLILSSSNPEGDRAVPSYAFVSYRSFGKTTVEIPLRFDVRGVYNVGLDTVEFYDILRLFRIRRRIGKRFTLIVTPRSLRLPLKLQTSVQEQENTVTDGGRETKNGGDLSGIREFNAQDTLRHVHWKLSARLSKMIVKTYWENTSSNIMVLADLYPYETEQLVNRRLTDSVVELALATSAQLAEEGVRSALVYPAFDEALCQKKFSSLEGQMRAADAFAMVPMAERGTLEQTLHEMDFSALQGGALYVISSMDPEELEKCLQPYLAGLNCLLECIVIRPQMQAPRGDYMKVLPLAALEKGVR